MFLENLKQHVSVPTYTTQSDFFFVDRLIISDEKWLFYQNR